MKRTRSTSASIPASGLRGLRTSGLLVLLLAASPVLGCGDDPAPSPTPDAGADVTDADDSGADTSDPDASTPGDTDVDTTPDTTDVAPDDDVDPDADGDDDTDAEDPNAEIDRLGELLRLDDEAALDEAADPTFRVGFGTRTLAWRVGAKPGQIGTAALPARDELLATAVSQILTILRLRDPDELLRRITDWQLTQMDESLGLVENGRYHTLFEPGRGIELPPAAHALVLSRNDTHVALVSADLYLPHEQFHRRVAHLVSERTGINRDRLFLVATHNHSAPHAVSTAIGIWTFGDRFDYRHWVYMTHQVADAIVDAWENREPATVRTARTTFADVQMNINSAGRADVRPEPGQDRVSVPVGYPRSWIEDDLILLRFDQPDGDPIASLFVLGMHPESVRDNHGITTGEFPRHAERKVEALTGAPAIWISGALGDVEPDREHNTPGANYWRGGFEPMDRMTTDIAEAVAALFVDLNDAEPVAAPTLLNLARDFHGPEAQTMPRSTYLGPDLPMVRLIHDSVRIRMHLVRIHDVLLVGSPGEIPTDMSFNLKTRMETGARPDAVFQGFVFDDAPDWVVSRVARNFETNVATPAAQVPIVASISLVNTYTGYVVTRWEFENRSHYRQSLTCFGPDTAEHMNQLAIALNEELHGGPPAPNPTPDFAIEDRRGVDRMTLWLRELDARIPDLARTFPVSDPDAVGEEIEGPTYREAIASNTDGFPDRIEATWRGGTNDVDLPRVRAELLDGETWTTAAMGPGPQLFVLFESPDVWTASWRNPPADTTVRFVIEGMYRGSTPGVSEPDLLWDPDGANVTYTLTTSEGTTFTAN